MPTVQIRIGSALHESLAAECERRSTTITEITRQLWEAWISRAETAPIAAQSVAGRKPGPLAQPATIKGVRGFAATTGKPIPVKAVKRPI